MHIPPKMSLSYLQLWCQPRPVPQKVWPARGEMGTVLVFLLTRQGFANAKAHFGPIIAVDMLTKDFIGEKIETAMLQNVTLVTQLWEMRYPFYPSSAFLQLPPFIVSSDCSRGPA